MRRLKNKRYDIGEVIENNVGSSYKILGVKSSTKKNMDVQPNPARQYHVECQKCNYKFWIRYDHLDNRKCYCETSNRPRVVIGINDIPTTDPWMVEYFQGGVEEAKKYSPYSNKFVSFKCPSCQKIANPICVYDLKRNHGMRCECNDNISYPEKYILSFLKQLEVKYDYQTSYPTRNFINTKKYKYDFYLKDYDCIIETNGQQHYEDSFFGSLKDIKQNDMNKKRLALDNGISSYVVLDCRKSDSDWIKKSIMDSGLPALLSFEECDIDWLKCEEYCMSNISKNICNYYMNTMESASQIAEKFNFGKTFVKKCLTKGNELGWCLYIPSKSHPVPIKLCNDFETILFKGTIDFMKKSTDLFGVHTEQPTVKKYKDSNMLYKGYYIKTITDTKEKFIAIYGDEAVKWYEQHQEFNA